jgi:polyketide synthase PksJ
MGEKMFKEISDISPYNEIWYKNCIYNAFLPVINHFANSIDTYLLNELSIFYEYHSTENIPLIDLRSFSAKSPFDFLQELGIKLETENECSNLVQDLIKAVDDDKPAIVLIDCFYEPIRPDTYQKNHWPHAILIYGYNKNTQNFSILEHGFRDSVIYEKRLIQFGDLENCYKGYLSNFDSYGKASYFEFGYIENYNPSTSLAANARSFIGHYITELLNCKESIIDSLNCINKFSKDLLQYDWENNSYSTQLDPLINNLNNLIHNLNIVKYVLSKLFGNQPELFSLIDDVVRNWSSIRAILAKYMFSTAFNPKPLKIIQTKLEELYILENQRYPAMFGLLENWEAKYNER